MLILHSNRCGTTFQGRTCDVPPNVPLQVIWKKTDAHMCLLRVQHSRRSHSTGPMRTFGHRTGIISEQRISWPSNVAVIVTVIMTLLTRRVRWRSCISCIWALLWGSDAMGFWELSPIVMGQIVRAETFVQCPLWFVGPRWWGLKKFLESPGFVV